jgi:RNA recognition motif-containing protein
MKLYVGNLSFETNETSLEDAFGQFGKVTDTVIMIDRTTNRSRGFGFVTMETAAEGTAAINGLNGVAAAVVVAIVAAVHTAAVAKQEEYSISQAESRKGLRLFLF